MPKVLDIYYTCQSCGFSPDEPKSMICPNCSGDLKGEGMPSITGTRDSFGIGKAFIHENEDGSKKEITTWKEWEKAGYKDAVTFHKGAMKEKIKESKEKRKCKAGKKLTIGA